MPVRNGARYVGAAIESILQQTYGNFEFIILDDHSEDESEQIIRQFRDPRIIVARPERREHLTHALNHARGLVRGELIARMDADDVAHPARFSQQVEYLQKNPAIGILGTQVRMIDSSGMPLSRAGRSLKPLEHSDIALELMFGCPLWHPTVMIRREILDKLGWYGSEAIAGREQFSGEDFDLWSRALQVTVIRNLPNTLLDYRIHGENLSLADAWRSDHCRNVVLVLARFLRVELGIEEGEAVAASLLGYSTDGSKLSFGHGQLDSLIRNTKALLEYGARTAGNPGAEADFRKRLGASFVHTILGTGRGIVRSIAKLAQQDPRFAVGVFVSTARRLV